MEVLDIVKAVFARQGIEPKEQNGVLTTNIRTGQVGSRLRVTSNERFLSVRVIFPIFAPDYRRQAMAETICRANFDLVQGCFELDMSDGEIRFRSRMPLLDGSFTEQQVDCLVSQSWSICDQYIPAFAEVAIGMMEPAVAVEKAEANWKEKIRNQATEPAVQ